MTDNFDIEYILSATKLTAIDYHESISSTNDRALQLIEQGWSYPGLVLTDRQLAGRGRGKHRWWSSTDSLTLSWLARITTSRTTMLPIAAALSIVDTIDDYWKLLDIPVKGRATIKWPNDILLDGNKIAGILIEVRKQVAVVGIGFNLNQEAFPELRELKRQPTSLCLAMGQRVSRQPFLIALLQKLGSYESVATTGNDDSIAMMIRQYNDRLELLGRTVQIELPNKNKFGGICRGLDSDGFLRLDVDGKMKKFASGTMQAIKVNDNHARRFFRNHLFRC